MENSFERQQSDLMRQPSAAPMLRRQRTSMSRNMHRRINNNSIMHQKYKKMKKDAIVHMAFIFWLVLSVYLLNEPSSSLPPDFRAEQAALCFSAPTQWLWVMLWFV